MSDYYNILRKPCLNLERPPRIVPCLDCAGEFTSYVRNQVRCPACQRKRKERQIKESNARQAAKAKRAALASRARRPEISS
jgi:hypothetical protein